MCLTFLLFEIIIVTTCSTRWSTGRSPQLTTRGSTVCLSVCLLVEKSENKGRTKGEKMDAEKPRPSSSNVQSSCTVGRKLQEECHRTYYTRKSGLKPVASLEKKTQELLSWRANITFSLEDTVCLHHEALYLIRYESRQTSCCDPFKMHKKSVRSKSQSLSCP